MKKTIITLALASGMLATAQAVTTQWTTADLTASNGTLTLPATATSGQGYGNFSLTAVLDVDYITNLLIQDSWTDILQVNSAASTQKYGVMVNGNSGSEEIGGLFGTKGQQTETGWRTNNGNLGANVSSGLEAILRSEDTSYESMAITLVVSGEGLRAWLTLVDDQGNTTNAGHTSGLGSSWRYSSYGNLGSIVFNSEAVQFLSLDSTILSEDTAYAANAAAINAASVPEPATATLSLLALAGLASRRRRK